MFGAARIPYSYFVTAPLCERALLVRNDVLFFGTYEEALAAIGMALKLDPFSEILNANRAYVLYFARRYPEALEQLQRTLEMDSSFPATHHRLGLVYVATGMHREAIDHFLQARKFSEDSPQPIGALGYIYGLSGDIGRWGRDSGLLLDMSKKRYVSAAIIAEVCVGLKRNDEALNWLDTAVREQTAAIVGCGLILVLMDSDPTQDSSA